MSRADKRHRVVHEEKSLRLFAFNNFINGYRPQLFLEQPTIVLRTRIKKEDEHPALQWEPLAKQILARKPMTHSTFVMDGTRLDATMEQDELTHHGVEGPLLKRIANMLSKLSPKGAQLIGAGTTAEIVAKTAICCATLRGLLGKVILVCPSLPDVQRSVEAAEKRLRQHNATVPLGRDGLPLMEAIVVLDANNAHAAPQWEKLLGRSFRVTINTIPVGTSLFGAIAAAAVPEAREECPTEGSRSEDLRCFVVTFRLSPYTKQAEQDVDESPVTENPNLPPPDDDDEDEGPGEAANAAGAEGEEEPIPVGESRYILSDLFNVKNATVRFEGNIVDGRTVANVHGRVELDEVVPALEAAEAGATVVLSAAVARDEDGRTMLKASTVANVAIGGTPTYYACGANFPAFSYSGVRQYYGAALIRGRKVVLCRSLEGVWRGMRFPHRPHCESYLTPYEAAVAAVMDQCDVSADTFYFHPAIAPVTYYPPSEKGACVTLFAAFATHPSADNGVEGDSKELLEQLHDAYDWYTYRAATAKLPTKAERDALADIRRNVQRAFEAGLYAPLDGHGVFGEDVPSAQTDEPAASVSAVDPAAVTEPVVSSTAAAVASQVGCGIHVSSLLVLQDPLRDVPAEEAAAVTRIDPSRVKVWDTAEADAPWAGISGGKGCVVLPAAHDMDLFAQQELPPVLPEDCPPAVTVVVAAEPTAVESLLVRGAEGAEGACLHAGKGAGMDTVMKCLEYADAFVARGAVAFTPIVQCLLRAARPELLCIGEGELPALLRGDLDVEACVLKADGAAAAACPDFLNIPFRAKLPFHPEHLATVLIGDGSSSLEERWGCEQLLWVAGSAWVSTSPLHKVSMTVTRATPTKCTVSLAASSPWWCCVEEGDRPEGLSTADWDPIHGSRRQELNILVRADPSRHEEVTAKVRAALQRALCSANDYRHWHRLTDPFNL